MITIRTEEGETRVYLEGSRVHTVNLTPTAAARLKAQLGAPATHEGTRIHLEGPPVRTRLGYVTGPDAELCELDDAALWALHDQPTERFGRHSLFGVKRELAHRMARPCQLCWHACNVDRREGEGWCRAGETPSRIEKVVHTGEEVEGNTLCLYLGPGCSHGCQFCTMHDLVNAPEGAGFTPADIVGGIDRMKGDVGSLTLIGGEPGIFLAWVLELLALEDSLPLVWNSNMYHTPDVARLLGGIVDMYVADLKFGNDTCARELGRTTPYMGPVLENISFAGGTGVPMVVRHVVMPGHLSCCTKPAMDSLAGIAHDGPVHVGVFIPEFRSAGCGLTRFTSDEELEAAKELARRSGLSVW